MRKFLTTAATALALAGTVVAVAAPADAQRWRGGYGGHYGGGYYRHGGGSGAAVAAGILGLGVGAAIASSNRGYYDRPYYYARPYPRGYYYAPPAYGYYYAPPPPPPAYYYGY